ncbi:MAG: 6-carboxytetrahydropterin synthase QueD [Spirochaetales bacterium]|nr:6-carboxytetrahydropterin synthase QueD [Spirochaetales bacterium]
MFQVRVEDNFAAAHYLVNYHGKCENLHGHNYRVRVFAEGEKLDNGGMLLDFGILKNTLKKVLDKIDHSLLNENVNYKEPEPSAELISFHIYKSLMAELPDAPICRVEVFETEKNMAAYIPD